MASVLEHPLHAKIALTGLVALIAFPLVMQAMDQPFYVVLASRILIFALVASSLNLHRRLRRHGVLRACRVLRCRRLRGRRS